MSQTFAEMTPRGRARRIEATRARIARLGRESGRPPRQKDKRLSLETIEWLRRCETALVDTDCSDEAYRELDKAATEAVAAEEYDEFRRRLHEYVVLRDVFPRDAVSVDAAVRPLMENLRDVIEAQDAA
jgi:hypothetical protein